MTKRIYLACATFLLGACVACVIAAGLLHVPKLNDAAFWFMVGTLGFALAYTTTCAIEAGERDE